MKNVPFAVANIGGLHGTLVEIFKDEDGLMYGSYIDKAFELVYNPFRDGNIHTDLLVDNGIIEVDYWVKGEFGCKHEKIESKFQYESESVYDWIIERKICTCCKTLVDEKRTIDPECFDEE